MVPGIRDTGIEEQYQNVFESTGKLAPEYRIELTESNCPVIQVPRTIPLSMRNKSSKNWII